jgi:hypothetical protein
VKFCGEINRQVVEYTLPKIIDILKLSL